MSKKVILSLCFMSLTLPLWAAETEPVLEQPESTPRVDLPAPPNPEKQSNPETPDKESYSSNYMGLGFSGGAISGVGFSYRQFFADHYGFKTSTVVYHNEYTSFFNLGMQGMWVLSENDWLRFYVLAGLADFYMGSQSYRELPSTSTPSETSSANADAASTDAGTSDTVVAKPTAPEDVQFESYYEAHNFVNLGAGIGLEIGRKEHGLTLALELPLVFSIKDFSSLDNIYPIPQISLIYNF